MNIEELYRTYFDIVYRYIRSVSRDGALAEEVTQETFFKALEKIDQFRGDCDVRVWLCQIAKNTLYDHLKKQKKQLLGDEKLEVTVFGHFARDCFVNVSVNRNSAEI